MWKSPPLFPGPSPPGRRPAGAWKAAAPLPSTRHPPTPLGKRCAFPTGPPAPRRRGKRGWRETRTEGLHLRLNPGWGGSLPDRCPGSLSGRCHHMETLPSLQAVIARRLAMSPRLLARSPRPLAMSRCPHAMSPSRRTRSRRPAVDVSTPVRQDGERAWDVSMHTRDVSADPRGVSAPVGEVFRKARRVRRRARRERAERTGFSSPSGRSAG